MGAIEIDSSKITGADSNKMCKNYSCQIAYFSKLWVPGTRESVAKVCPSYDPSWAIFSSFNFMVVFNIAAAEIAESQLMLFENDHKIEKTEDRATQIIIGRTLTKMRVEPGH